MPQVGSLALLLQALLQQQPSAAPAAAAGSSASLRQLQLPVRLANNLRSGRRTSLVRSPGLTCQNNSLLWPAASGSLGRAVTWKEDVCNGVHRRSQSLGVRNGYAAWQPGSVILLTTVHQVKIGIPCTFSDGIIHQKVAKLRATQVSLPAKY